MDLTSPFLDARFINPDAVVQFERDGFVVLPGALNAASVARVSRWIDELAAAPEVPGRHWVYHEQDPHADGGRLLSRIENFSPFHAGLRELAEQFGRLAACFLGEASVLFKEKINFKLPGADGFKAHQDAQAGWSEYADYFVTVALCIDVATAENGCLEFAAGHHRSGLYPEWSPLDANALSDMAFQLVPTVPGDVICFDSFTPHASKPNRSTQQRRFYFATYNRVSAGDQRSRYLFDKHEAYPPDIEREAGRHYVYRV